MKFPLPLAGDSTFPFHWMAVIAGSFRLRRSRPVRRRRLYGLALAQHRRRWHPLSVALRPAAGSIRLLGRIHVRVRFPEDTTQWKDDTPPEKDSRFTSIFHGIRRASWKSRGFGVEAFVGGGDYMQATVVSYQDGFVQFQVGFDRYRMAPELTDGIYNLQPDDSVIASIRMKRGEGVIEGIFVNGIPLENISNGAAMAKARQEKRPRPYLTEASPRRYRHGTAERRMMAQKESENFMKAYARIAKIANDSHAVGSVLPLIMVLGADHHPRRWQRNTGCPESSDSAKGQKRFESRCR